MRIADALAARKDVSEKAAREVETQDELVPILSLGRFVIRTSLLANALT